MSDEKLCLSCGSPVKGRADKKFCDDQCRNLYNNSLNSAANNYVRNINNILRRNRKILEELNTDPSGKTKIPRTKLLQQGFQFDYITNILNTKAGKTYYFCYEHGYLPIENDWLMLVIRNEH